MLSARLFIRDRYPKALRRDTAANLNNGYTLPSDAHQIGA